MDATRLRDSKHVMLKTLLPEERPHELRITHMLSSPELSRDRRNHCVPLLDVIEISDTGQKFMVMPFLRSFNNPRLQTFGEFVGFFTQVCEVSSLECLSSPINSDSLRIRASNSCINETLHTGTRNRRQMRIIF